MKVEVRLAKRRCPGKPIPCNVLACQDAAAYLAVYLVDNTLWDEEIFILEPLCKDHAQEAHGSVWYLPEEKAVHIGQVKIDPHDDLEAAVAAIALRGLGPRPKEPLS